MIKTFTAMLFVLLIGVGCSNVETRTFDISLKNDSSKTVIVWLTKNGPVYEKGWKAPEDLAIEHPSAEDPIAFQTVPPGKTAFTNNLTGKFAPGVSAILRLYVGQRTFSEILAISRGSPDRIELPLVNGPNQFIVKDQGSGVTVDRGQ